MNTPENLQGKFIDLEVLMDSHEAALQLLIDTPEFWSNPLSPINDDNFADWFQKALKTTNDGGQVSFAVRRKADQQIIGTTRYYKISEKDRRLAIGYTWYLEQARGSQVNPECKLLLLCHAFDALGMNRVEFYINTLNHHSRAAIKKLGAKEEGILRLHRISPMGIVRDTAVYSIIKPEWPEVKERLRQRLV